ncbi:hypothetical protein ACIF9R_12220 [Streptomyces sp. NPDC086080]|uniref:hypothetical protein n=1 Tax=Streptomyces sp. NPDC086080 TaxID=3365748 RepID=UPI0037D7E75A
MRMPSWMSGVAIGEGLVDSVDQYMGGRLRRLGASALVSVVLGQDVDESKLPPKAKDMDEFESLLASASMVGSVKVWKRTRIVYDVNPDFATSLVDMELDTEFPNEVLKHLPHPDPVFVFREPRICKAPSDGGGEVAVRGFLVTCQPRPNLVVSTMDVGEDDDDTSYRVVMILDLLPKSGKVKERAFVELLIPRGSGSTTVRKIIDEVRVSYGTGDGYVTPNNDGSLKTFMYEMALLAVPHMLYACCANPDVKEASAPAQATRAKKGGRPKRQTTVLRLGWHLGPAIRRFNAGIERLRRAGASTGKTVIPHVRRGHPHIVLYGVAKALKKVKWFPPTLVNADRFGDEAEGLVVPFE